MSLFRWLAPALLLLAGCGTSLPPPSDPGKARAALQEVLAAWQQGETPKDLFGRRPSVHVADEDWHRGYRLSQFEIGADEQRHGLQLRYTVALLRVDPQGRPLPPCLVAYTVATAPSVSVVREETTQP